MPKYEKPVFKRVKGVDFVLKALRAKGDKIACRQCSGCHGCR